MTAEPVTYAAATVGDRDAVVELLRACALPVEDLPATLADFFVARADGQVIGSVGLDVLGNVALVRSLAVAPGFRGQGVARRLWQHGRAHALALGVRELFLLTTTAEAIFAGWGFARVSRQEAPDLIRRTAEFRSLCPDSAALMRLPLA